MNNSTDTAARMELLARVLFALSLAIYRYEGNDTNTNRLVRLAGFALTSGMDAGDALDAADHVCGLLRQRYDGDQRGTQSAARGRCFFAMLAINDLATRTMPGDGTPVAAIEASLAKHVDVLTR